VPTFCHVPSLPLLVTSIMTSRTRSTSCSSTASQSSMASIYARIHQSTHLAEPQKGLTNAYGSFTTTIPAALWLRDHFSFRGEHPDRDYDTPPDSPLSLFSSLTGARRSPSISRTLLTDPDYTSPPSPAVRLHPVLNAVEMSSRLSSKSICSTCMKQGTNFPRCTRCDETWCSRPCRLQGGKKHICAIPNV